MELTEKQIEALEEMITRRMENTGEDRETACWHIRSYISQLM
jgi:ribosomal protein L16/L10AE